MPILNSEIARLFDELADLLEIGDANPFRVRAYRTAARNIATFPRSVADMVKAGEDLHEIPAIGKELAIKITTIVETGHLPALDDLSRQTPPDLIELTRIPGLGPKRVKALFDQLGVKNIADLEAALRAGKVGELRGFGPRMEQAILQEIERKVEKRHGARRLKLVEVEDLARPLLAYLAGIPGVKKVTAAGSYRRRLETVGDLDILVACGRNRPVMDAFTSHEDVRQVIASGPTRSTVVLRFGLQVDIRVVPEVSYGAALQYFTGSKAHNVAIRTMGVRDGLKINEYGVFRGTKRVAGRTEEEVYAQIGLPYVEPEIREDRGEIEAAQQGKLPHLVTQADIRGDLHIHTNATDGRATLEEMARAAQRLGYEYLAITDHSKRLTMTRGLDETRLAQQIREIEALNAELKGFRLLKSAEVDILEDGTLDLPDSILRQLDLVVCSVHSKFNLSAERQAERIIRVIKHPYFMVLAHPTGRLIDEREGYDVDMEHLMQAAKSARCVMELNAQPERLDLTDLHCRMGRDMGVMVAISSDAHSEADLSLMRFGVYQARRGWLEPENVLNTRTWPQLQRILRRR